ncbi:MAG TPA: ABC transporter permease [Gemmatimonadales bacterium]|nr:ABC transporter permease [Gemmatimonadales bacterium]HRZ09151.1 ABC transporter permease [Gemmatimonadales bacterium]
MTPKDSLPHGAPSANRAPLPWARLALAGLGALLVLFIVGPLLRLLILATPASLGEALRDQELLASIALTVSTATAATLIGALLGVPLAYLLARRSFRGRRIVEALVELPVVIPHPVAGIALLLFLGRNSAVGGAFARLGLEFVNHVPGIVAGMLFVSVPILVSGAREAFRAVDPRLERVARTLGDPPAVVFRRVTLPLAGRGVLAAAVLAWARSVSEFGAIVILTYNPQVASVLIYDRFTTLGLPAAVPASLLLLAVALGVFALVRMLQPAERR